MTNISGLIVAMLGIVICLNVLNRCSSKRRRHIRKKSIFKLPVYKYPSRDQRAENSREARSILNGEDWMEHLKFAVRFPNSLPVTGSVVMADECTTKPLRVFPKCSNCFNKCGVFYLFSLYVSVLHRNLLQGGYLP